MFQLCPGGGHLAGDVGEVDTVLLRVNNPVLFTVKDNLQTVLVMCSWCHLAQNGQN